MIKNSSSVLGVDIGGTNIRVGLIAPDFTLSSFEMTSSVRLFEESEGNANALAAYLRKYCNINLSGALPGAVSLGFPSTLNKTKTQVLSTPNLSGFDNLNVVELLQKELPIPVYINRDVNLLMISDIHSHGLETADVVIGCYIGTGLGNAIYIKGELLSGKNGVAGELGHVPVLGSHRRCRCGNVGCMETVASGRYLEELHTKFFPEDLLCDLFTKHSHTPILQEYIEGLSVPVAAEINLFDPDYVVLGGGVLQMKDFPLQMLKNFIGQHTRKPFPYENLQIIISSQNQKSGVIGAGLYAFNRMRKGI